MARERISRSGPSRRGLLAGATGVAALPLASMAASQTPARAPSQGPSRMDITLKINGRDHRLSLDPRTTLLDESRWSRPLILRVMSIREGPCDGARAGVCE